MFCSWCVSQLHELCSSTSIFFLIYNNRSKQTDRAMHWWSLRRNLTRITPETQQATTHPYKEWTHQNNNLNYFQFLYKSVKHKEFIRQYTIKRFALFLNMSVLTACQISRRCEINIGIIKFKRLFWIGCHRIPRLPFPANLDNQMKCLFIFFLPQIKSEIK